MHETELAAGAGRQIRVAAAASEEHGSQSPTLRNVAEKKSTESTAQSVNKGKV
jgi:hypothetical protein